jgi:hypothetical protein
LDKLKVLLILLLAAVLGLAVSLYLLALAFTPETSPTDVFYQIVTEGLPAGVPFVIPLSTLLFLSTVLASMVGVIYFLVLPEMKDYYSASSEPAGKEASAMVMRTLKPDERKVVGVLKVHGGTYIQKFITQEAGLSRLDPPGRRVAGREGHRTRREEGKLQRRDAGEVVSGGDGVGHGPAP